MIGGLAHRMDEYITIHLSHLFRAAVNRTDGDPSRAKTFDLGLKSIRWVRGCLPEHQSDSVSIRERICNAA